MSKLLEQIVNIKILEKLKSKFYGENVHGNNAFSEECYADATNTGKEASGKLDDVNYYGLSRH